MSDYRQPKAVWSVSLDGKDLTDKVNPRLSSLTIAEKRGDEADQLDIVLNDPDGKLQIPPDGAVLTVALGWERGSGLPLGLVAKGRYKVDEAKFRGPPDQITIRARSADLAGGIRVRKERAFVGHTVKQIVSAIAADNGLTPRIDAALGAKTVPALGPGAKSDAALLRLLGKRFDAVATVKAGALIFAPIGKGQSASGKPLGSVTIDRTMTGTVDYGRTARQAYDGAEASWHDKSTGKRKTVKAGHKGTGKARRLRKVYANEADAKHAAAAAHSRTSRAKAQCTLDLPLGRPDIFPNKPVTLTGFKPEINARKWVVSEASHSMDGQGGLKTSLTLEALG